MIYLDYNATTPLAPEVLDAMRPYLETHFGNASSIHQAGREARAAIDDARERLARLLGARPHEIIFTGGGTEADNLAILGLARSRAEKGKRLITCATEHHAVLQAFEYLERHEDFCVTHLPVDHRGLIDVQMLRDALREDTTLVSIMSANNETGVIQPLDEIAELCREHDVLLHSDMIQSFGKQPVRAGDADAISITAHKFYGPKGVGMLYLRSGISIQKIQFGGSHENERRPGTENVASIAGLARAAELALQEVGPEQVRQAALRDRLWEGIHAAFPTAILNGDHERRLAGTLNVSFPGLDGEGLLMNLDLEGICASSGSACMVGSIVPSHVLLAMGVPEEAARSTVRFSLGKATTAEEIEQTITAMERITARLNPEPVHP
ncbi:MAG: cysteine desulfurase family protein [Chthoniobacteraceae bacterium]